MRVKDESAGPRVLVVLPTLGERIDTLRETLESVKVQRGQVNLRLVVVTPRAAKEARALAKTYGADIIDDPRTGISEAINRGIASRKNEEFYAWIGDDDLFRPLGLKTLQSLLDHNPEAIVAYGGCDYITDTGRIIAVSNAGRWAQILLNWGPDLIPHPGSMIRLDDLEAAGMFDPELKYAMDLDVFLKLRRRGKFVCTRESVSAFRWHPDSLTVANRKLSSAEASAIKRRHLPSFVRPLQFIWEVPINAASARAARLLNKRSSR